MPADSPNQIRVNSDDAQLKMASARLGVPFVKLANRVIPEAVLTKIPRAVAEQYKVIAYDLAQLASGRKVIKLAVADPELLQKEAPLVIADLHAKEGMVIEVALASATEIQAVLSRYPADAATAVPAITPADRSQKDLPKEPMKPALLEAKPEVNLGPKLNTTAPLPNVFHADEQTIIPDIDLTQKKIPSSVLNRIPETTARKYRVIVFGEENNGKTIQVAAQEPRDIKTKDLLDFIGNRNGLKISLYRASVASIEAGLGQYQPELAQETKAVRPIDGGSKVAPKPLPKVELPAFQKQVDEKHIVNQVEKPEGDQQSLKDRFVSLGSALLKNQPEDKQSPKKAVPEVPTVTAVIPAPSASPEGQPGLRTDTHPDLLIPQGADVERDVAAIVGQPVETVADLETVVKTGFIPKIVAAIVLLATKMQASDIHLQSDEKTLLLRFRVDGILNDIVKMPANLLAPLVSRIKILSNLKIDEQRIPQDGRFDVQVNKREIDLRVSTFPTVRGEKVVIRLLDKTAGLLTLDKMGLIDSRLKRLQEQMRKPYGVILATGPTGSGKSTTLYAILREIANPGVNVVTLEDPVEYEIPGINQAQIKPKIGFGFAEGLRSILRQDPNIIMVGEIRDVETASMVTHAALTGHLVLSTLHTNDAAGAIPRLINMGVEPFLMTSSLNAVVGQRLVRRLCQKCRRQRQPQPEIVEEVTQILSDGKIPELLDRLKQPLSFYEAVGCDECTDGYKGRVGVYEVLAMSEEIEKLAIKKASAQDIAAAATAEGMVNMEQDGLIKALSGETTLEEILRVTKTG